VRLVPLLVMIAKLKTHRYLLRASMCLAMLAKRFEPENQRPAGSRWRAFVLRFPEC
jgi:hypothetical protein